MPRQANVGHPAPPAGSYTPCAEPDNIDPRVETLVNELIGRVADKWTMLILEVLGEKGELRFTRIGAFVPGISQKMLTQTLRAMERDGLVRRTVHPVVPPRVEYVLTDLGMSLSAAFCGVWIWAGKHLVQVESARASFDEKLRQSAPTPTDRPHPAEAAKPNHSSLGRAVARK